MLPLQPGRSYAKEGDVTTREKIDIYLGLVPFFGYAVFKLLTAGFYRPSGAKTFEREVAYSLIRALSLRFNVVQMQFIAGDTSTTAYQGWVDEHRAEGYEVLTESIAEGAKLHWVGPKRNDRVLLYFHGGGYICRLDLDHLSMLKYLREEVKKKTGSDIGTVALEYTLVPLMPYPGQLRQANAALHHLLSSGVDPANIIIAGDSAGGNLALALHSHIMHPHPLVPAPPVLSGPTAGTLLISPWCTLATTATSFRDNACHDYISPSMMDHYSAVFKANSPLDTPGKESGFWAEPLEAPENWWAGLAQTTRRVLFTTGEWECFRDDILATKQKIEASQSAPVEVIVEKESAHDTPMADFQAKRKPSELMEDLTQWVADVLVQKVE